MTAYHFRDEPETETRARPNGKHHDRRDQARAGRTLSIVWADEIEISLDTGGVVDGLIPGTGLGVMYGESGSAKTFNAIDLACHVAAGRPWRGMEVEQGVVVYIAAEAPESVKRRVWAWKRYHGVEHLPALVVQSAVDLVGGDAAALVDLVRQVAAEHGRVALTVVDTLARAMVGDENAPDDMGKFVAGCGQIREATGAFVLIIHHSGKDLARGARGHSSLRAATDLELECTNGETGGCVRVTKSRDDTGGRSFGFRLDTVELGANAKGRTVTTCVAVEAEAPAVGAHEAKPKGANEKVVHDALLAALVDQGEPAPVMSDVPSNVKVVRVMRWEAMAIRYLPQPETKRKREAFNRAVTSLVARGAVRHVEGWAWLP